MLLPQDVVSAVLLHMLSVKDIQRIDRAMDQTLWYPTWRALLSMHAFRSGTWQLCSAQELKWLLQRGIDIVEINTPSTHVEQCVEMLSASAPNLQRFSVRVSRVSGLANYMTDIDVMRLATACSKLRDICLARCKLVTSDSLVVLAKHCPHLDALDITDCFALSNRGIVALAKHCSQIKTLNMERCSFLTDDAIFSLAESCLNLLHINLNSCNLLTDAALVALAENSSHLTKFSISDNRKISNVSIVLLAHRCFRLSELSVEYCCQITDASLEALSDCAYLRKLSINGCNKITTAGAICVVNMCSDLMYFSAEECRRVKRSLLLKYIPYSIILKI